MTRQGRERTVHMVQVREVGEVGVNVGDAVAAALGDKVNTLPVHKVATMLFTYKPERDVGTVTVLGDRRQHGILAVYDGREEDAVVRYSYWTYLPPVARLDRKDQFNGFHMPRITPDVRLTVRCEHGHTQTAWGSTVYWLHDKGHDYYCSECEGGKRVKQFKARVPAQIVEVLSPEAACHQNAGIMDMVNRLSKDDLADTVVRLPRVWAVIPIAKLPVDNLKVDDPLRIQDRISRQDKETGNDPHCIIPVATASKFKIQPDRILLEAVQGVGMIDTGKLYGEHELDYSCHFLNRSRVV